MVNQPTPTAINRHQPPDDQLPLNRHSRQQQPRRTLSVLLILSAGVKDGVKGSFHVGAVRDLRPDCSWSTHSSAACRRSSVKLVSSHTSLQQNGTETNRNIRKRRVKIQFVAQKGGSELPESNQ
mgnify:CR=1 FL=1